MLSQYLINVLKFTTKRKDKQRSPSCQLLLQ